MDFQYLEYPSEELLGLVLVLSASEGGGDRLAPGDDNLAAD
jgi:hypothetical protein